MKKRSAKCGTESGYTRHYRLREPACEPCLAAKRDSNRRRYIVARSKQALDQGVNIPAITMARLYLTSQIDMQMELDRILAPSLIDELIRIHDEYVDATRKAS